MISTPQRQELENDFSNNVRIFTEKLRERQNSGKIEFASGGSAGGVEGWSFMGANHRDEGTSNPAVSEVPVVGSKFKSVRRVFRIMDLVSQRGENLTAKELARELGTNLSSCYYLLNILADEGYIRKISGGGYRIGPTIPLLNEGSRSDFDARIEPVVKELAQRAQRHAYAAVLSDGEVVVTQAKAPEKQSYVGVVEGFHGASHALALGKVLLAGAGAEYVQEYIDDHGLEAFTPRTIVRPNQLHAHLNKVLMVGVATDFEEFAQNLCCFAAPVTGRSGKVEGAIGLSTTTRRVRGEGRQLIELVQWAATEATALLVDAAYEGRSSA
jgi:DNA-binding IclR family transcriptional regulator